MTAELSTVLVDLVRADPRASAKVARQTLKMYMERAPPDYLVGRALQMAKKYVNGFPDKQGRQLQQIETFFNGLGHTFTVTSVSAAEHRDVMANLAQEQRKWQKKNLSGTEPKDITQEVPQDTRFLYGWTWYPEYAERMVPTLRGVCVSDACHGRTDLRGSFFGAWGFDSNDHMICLGLAFYYDNESKATWTLFLRGLRDHCPGLDLQGAENTFIADGDKGFSESFKALFGNAKRFYCCQHKKANVLRSGNTADAKAFTEAVHATTLQTLQGAKANYSFNAQNHLKGIPDDELYLWAAQGRTWGKVSSQLAETANNTLRKCRERLPAEAFMEFFRQEQERLSRHRLDAAGCPRELPPKLWKRLEADILKCTNLGWYDAEKSSNGEWVVTDRGQQFRTALGLFDCSCGGPKVERWPCRHMLSAAKSARVDFVNLFHPLQRTAAWRETYVAIGEVKTPAPNEVWDTQVPDLHLQLPVAGKKPRGRPPKAGNKRKLGCLEVSTLKAAAERHAETVSLAAAATRRLGRAEAMGGWGGGTSRVDHRDDCSPE